MPPNLPRCKLRILVVEDNEDSRVTLQMILTALGHEVLLAQDGETAVLEAPAFMPDIVIMDVGLPGISGHDAAQRILERREDKNLMIVALTGWGTELDLEKSRQAGIRHHLTKPLDLGVLRELMQAHPRYETGPS